MHTQYYVYIVLALYTAVRHAAVLHEPAEFFDALIAGISSARSRITLMSLYLGTGEKERRLLDSVHAACERNTQLRVTVLLDHSRGTRGGEASSAALLRPLCLAFPGRVSVKLFLMPQLWGRLGRLLPQRYNEVGDSAPPPAPPPEREPHTTCYCMYAFTNTHMCLRLDCN